MPRINLLPWRDEERKERKLAFIVAIMGATVASLVAAFAAYLLMNSMIDGQNARNDRLRAEIKMLDKQIEEINSLESAKQKFVARMNIIEQLQSERAGTVHMFDEIVRQLPEGVYLTGLQQKEKRLKFEGVAQSSTRVSAFMRNIDGSEWLRNPDLEVVETKPGQTAGSSFTLFADQVNNNAAPADAANGSNKKKLASAGGRK
jgi:type IV pilus assembly protein PilN